MFNCLPAIFRIDTSTIHRNVNEFNEKKEEKNTTTKQNMPIEKDKSLTLFNKNEDERKKK